MIRWTMLAPVAFTIAAAPAATPQQRIEAAMADSAAGWNGGDLARFVAIYAADAVFVTPDGLVRGRDAIAAHYAPSFAGGGNRRGTLDFQFLALRELDPAHALLFARWRLTPGGLAKGETGMTTLVFRREADGWKIIADHSS